MKAISLLQPWATLIAEGAKKIETRSWPTTYRGPIAIHASKRFTEAMWMDLQYGELACLGEELAQMGYTARGMSPTGAIIAVGMLVDCRTILHRAPWFKELSPGERDYGDYTEGRYGWFIENVQRLAVPDPWAGSLGLWDYAVPLSEILDEIQLASLRLMKAWPL